MKNIIRYIIGGIAGIILLTASYLSYTFYKALPIVYQTQATTAQIVQFIQQSQQSTATK